MQAFINFLKGKKTYCTAIAGAIVVFAHLTGLIDSQTFNTLVGLLGFGGLAALRASK